jgi:putative sterol carrier protein
MAETPKEFMELLKARFKEKPEAGKDVNAIYQFILAGEGGGDWWVDLTKSPGEVGEGKNAGAGCTITMEASDFVAMMKKTANPMVLFMSKKLKVDGDLTLSLKLQSVLNLL